jgi:hypothetical protein
MVIIFIVKIKNRKRGKKEVELRKRLGQFKPVYLRYKNISLQ